MLKLCKIYACANGPLGLHLSRAPWDPYPWVSEVQKGSSAHAGGIRSGDTVLELNGSDVLGKKISEIAAHIREHWQSGANYITVVVWRNKVNDCGDGKHNHRSHRTTATATGTQNSSGSSTSSSSNSSDADDDAVDECEDDVANANSSDDEDCDDCDANAHTVNQRSLQKFATCLQNIAQLLECPVCLEVVKPPGWQCCNGHVLCNNCRSRSVKCPVCRVPLGPRGRCLLSDKLFTLLAESFPCDRAATPKERGSKTRAKQKSTPQQIELHNREKTEEQQKSKDAKLKTKSLLQQQQQRHEGKLNKIEWQQQQASKPDVGRSASLAKEMSELRLACDVAEDKLQADGDNSPPRTPPRHKKRAYKPAESHQHRNHPNAQQPEAECFSVKRANDITLEQIKMETKWPPKVPAGEQGDATAGDTEAVQLETVAGEGDLLLQGTRQQWPRVNFTMGQGDESQPLNIQRFPEEILLQRNNKSPTDSIMASKSLSAMTTTTTTTANTTPRASSSPDAHTHDEHNAPKFWLYLREHWLSISELVGLLVICIVIWMLAYVLLPDQVEPNSAIMRLAFLFIGAQLSGILVTFIHLPDMLGMLFFGVIYTNVGLADFSQVKGLEVFLRKMALINIMLLAGLGLDGKAFRKLWTMILRLTLVPTVAEVTVIAVLSRYMLNMPWLWGILLGLVITAVSPNVVVTVMLKLKEERLGLNKGIHTLIYAMTSCNDVVAIFLFGVISGVIFSQGTITEQILQGPIGVGIGVVFGYVYGLMLQFVPSKNSAYRNGQRLVLCLLGGTISVLGSEAIGYPSAGALGCMTIAFVAGLGWKRQYEKQSQQEQLNEASSNAAKRLDLLWKFLKPVSFALIGKEIHFSVLNGEVVGYGILLVLLGSLFRLGFAYISTYGGQLTTKERAYITISGFPKATVQAALGPIALDLAHTYQADEATVALASRVLIISVLAIIFTAPLGAILMLRLAPHWLERSVGDLPTTSASSRNGGSPGQDLDSVASCGATESRHNHSHSFGSPAADTTPQQQRHVVANGVELAVVPMEPESVLPLRRDDRADDERSRP